MQVLEPALAIVIPTYNRSSILAENILEMLPELRNNHIPLYISDDSSNDDTAKLIDELRQEYDAIHYRRNIPALKHDENFISTLQWPEHSKYVWVLSDALKIKQGCISDMVQQCKYSNADFILVTTHNRATQIAPRSFTNANEFAAALGWHITMTGATIFSRKQIETANYKEILQATNFPQASFILRGIVNNPFEVLWTGAQVLEGNTRKESYWIKNVFSVFLNDWILLVQQLPNQYNDIKKLLYKAHAANTGLFSLKNLLYFRMKGALTYRQANMYKRQIKLAANQSYFIFLLVCIVPAKGISFLVSKMK